MSFLSWAALEGTPRATVKVEGQTIDAIVEEIGFGPGQIMTLGLSCGSFFAEGLELLLLSLLATSIASELGNSPVGHGFILSTVFTGALLGNVLSGPFADLAGRSYPIITGYGVIIFFSVLSSFMNSLIEIALLRFFVGLGFGLGQPAGIVLMNEVTPRAWRLSSTACSSLFFGLGVLLAVLMVTLQDVWLKEFTEIEWRLLLRIASIPMLVFAVLSIILLPESPHFYAATGDYALARDCLRRLGAWNKRNDVCVMFQYTRDEVPMWNFPAVRQIGSLFTMPELPSTLGMVFISLVLNFALYGSSYVVPQVLTQVLFNGVNTLAPATVLLLTCCLAGGVLLIFAACGNCVGQKTGIMASLIGSAVCALLFNRATDIYYPETMHKLLLVASCFGLCAMPAFAILWLIQASTEMYPTLTTATAVGACLAVGRVGAITAPLAFDAIETRDRIWTPFFDIMFGLEIASAVIVYSLDLERGRDTSLGTAKEKEAS